MRILSYKAISYEDALDAAIRAEKGLSINNELTVNFVMKLDGMVAVVEPIDLDEINLTGDEHENYIVIREK